MKGTEILGKKIKYHYAQGTVSSAVYSFSFVKEDLISFNSFIHFVGFSDFVITVFIQLWA